MNMDNSNEKNAQHISPNEMFLEGAGMILKGYFLKLLQDDDIKRALQATNMSNAAVSRDYREDVNELQRDNTGLRSELQSKEAELRSAAEAAKKQGQEKTELLSENKKMKSEIDRLKTAVERGKEQQRELQEKAGSYAPFDQILELYTKYQSLSENVRTGLVGILGDNVLKFTSVIGNLDTIKNLWDKCHECISNPGKFEESDINMLCTLFDEVFQIYNALHPESLLVRDEKTTTGMKTDDNLHIRIGNGLINGEIEKVLLKGFSNRNTRNTNPPLKLTVVSTTERR